MSLAIVLLYPAAMFIISLLALRAYSNAQKDSRKWKQAKEEQRLKEREEDKTERKKERELDRYERKYERELDRALLKEIKADSKKSAEKFEALIKEMQESRKADAKKWEDWLRMQERKATKANLRKRRGGRPVATKPVRA